MSNKQKNARAERITTPIGTAVYPYLSRPDNKFDDEGVYRVRFRLPEDEAEELMASIQEKYDEGYKLTCSREGTRKLKTEFMPWRNAVDEDGEETGEIEFNFKSKASGINRETKEAWSRKVPIFDSKGRPLDTKKVNIGSGSKIKVSFFVSPWYNKKSGFGVTLRIVGVQIIDLVEGGGNTAESMGFGEEDGWEAGEEDEVVDRDADETEAETEEVEADADDDELTEEGGDDDEDEKPKGKRSDRFGLDKSIAKLNGKDKAKAATKVKPKAKPAAKAKPKVKAKAKAKGR